MSPPGEQRRKHDNLPPEVKDYIDAAAEAGAEKAILKLYAEIGKAGIRKAALILGAVLAGVLSWLGFGGHLPK
jgi:hypothetical protein